MYPLHLSFPDHVHHLKSLQCSPRRLKREEAHPWLRQPLEKPMILFDQGIEVFHLPQFHVFWQDSSGFEVDQSLGIGCVFLERPITRGTHVVGSAEATRSWLRDV